MFAHDEPSTPSPRHSQARQDEHVRESSLGDVERKRQHPHGKRCASYNDRVGENAFRENTDVAA
jgi:hypothetical protein